MRRGVRIPVRGDGVPWHWEPGRLRHLHPLARHCIGYDKALSHLIVLIQPLQLVRLVRCDESFMSLNPR